ncbi:PHP domain-containing protein [Lutibacter sp. B2]|nr:PHP domain-containing protein [Lutibacter sp. B2]
MKIFADYHTHTIYSHGKGTIKENVEYAIKRGLKEIAITDHSYGHKIYGIKKDDIHKMRKEIDDLNASNIPIKVKLGVEANVIGFNGALDVDEDFLKNTDILLAGYHFGAVSSNLIEDIRIHGRNFLSKNFTFLDKKARIRNTDAIIKAIYQYNIDIITHPGDKGTVDIREIAKAAVDRNTLLEINSPHGYLTVEGIKIAMKEGVKFVINSDAHRPQDVGNVEAGIKRAIEAGLCAEQIVNAKEAKGEI